jgi:hypothetical protein
LPAVGDDDIDIPATLAAGRIVFRSPWNEGWKRYALPLYWCLIGLGVCLATLMGPSPGRWIALGFGAFVLVLSGSAVWTSINGYRLRSIDVPGNREQVNALALQVAGALGWSVRHSELAFVCKTPPSGWSWGETITIMAREGQILFNSRASTGARRMAITFRKHAKNYQTFRSALEAMQRGEGAAIVPASSEIGPGTTLGCAVVLVPIVGALGAFLVRTIREDVGPASAPSYAGEPAQTPESFVGGFVVVGLFASFFLVVLVKLVAGTFMQQKPSILSLPHTLLVFSGSSVIGALFASPRSGGPLLIAAAVALVVGVLAARRAAA